jgi:hypothetical protein
MLLLLTSTSKNYNDLKYFLRFLRQDSLLEENRLTPIPQTVDKKIFTWTLLKSPHVNKTAREQLSSNTYLLKLAIRVENLSRFSLLYKRIPTKMFSNVSTTVTFVTSSSSAMNKLPLNLTKTRVSPKKLTPFSLKEYDVYGENSFVLDKPFLL